MVSKLSKVYLSTMIFTLILIVAAMSASASPYPTTEKILDAAVEKAMVKSGATAASFAIMENGDLIYSKAFGFRDSAAKIATSTDTLFNFGSVGKIITATAVMKLVENGRVDLDAPAAKYITDFSMSDPRYKKITVRMLLNHTSGLPGSNMNGWICGEEFNDKYLDDTLSILKTSRLKADPGRYNVYCNDGFTLAEILVQRVSGRKYSEFVKDEIFTPLAMTKSRYADSEVKENEWIRLYKGNKTPLPNEIVNSFGAGGIITTPEDMCRLLDIFTLKGKGRNGVRILSERSVAEMTTGQAKNNDFRPQGLSWSNVGLEWDTVEEPWFAKFGIRAFNKGGGTSNFGSTSIILPDYGIVIAGSEAGNWFRAYMTAVEALTALLIEKGVIKETAFDMDSPVAKEADKIPYDIKLNNGGYYGGGARAGMSCRVSFKDDKMKLDVYKNGKWVTISENLTYRENGRFADGSDPYGEEWFFENYKDFGTMLVMSYPDAYQWSMRIEDHFAQKLPSKIDADPAAEKIWEGRAGYWLPVGDNWTTMEGGELSNAPVLLAANKDLPGMIFFGKGPLAIENESTLRTFVHVPIWYGRDTFDVKTFKRNGEEWLKAESLTYKPAKSVKTLEIGKSTLFTIAGDGYSEWLKLPENELKVYVSAAGKGRYILFDRDFKMLKDSQNGDKFSFTVKGGWIRLLAPANGAFTVFCKTDNQK